MPFLYNDALAHAILDSIDATFNGGTLELATGAPPAQNAVDTGTVIATGVLPADCFNPASGRSKTKLGTWQVTGNSNAGAGTTAGHFRLKNAGATQRIVGTVTVAGGGGDMTLDNTSIANNQVVTINTFTISM